MNADLSHKNTKNYISIENELKFKKLNEALQDSICKITIQLLFK